jgi:hypothetical protein
MAGALKRAFGAIASAAALNSGLVIWCLPAPFNQVSIRGTLEALSHLTPFKLEKPLGNQSITSPIPWFLLAR